jgi:hypothetical protein
VLGAGSGSGSGSVDGRGAVPLKAVRRYDRRGQESSRYNITFSPNYILYEV